MEERIATLHAQMMAQQMAYQQSLQQHYNTQMQNMASFFQSMQTPGASTPPPLPMFAPPPPPPEFFPVPAPVAPGGTPVSILTLALTCASMLQILMTSLGV